MEKHHTAINKGFSLKKFLIIVIFLSNSIFYSLSQSYAPAPNEVGSTAIHKDSSIITAWASGIQLQRGYLNISNKNLGLVSFGIPENALNHAEGNAIEIVSLGDSGVAILTFENPISNGNGYDFAIFENGFTDNYLELAFVEVSSNGIDYIRFPAISEIPIDNQMGNFEFSDCRYVNNLAGKYRQGYGTPFDLEELNSQNIDLNHITHIKIIDAVGSINPNFGTFDSNGNIINDPWPSEYESGGFDLDAIGIIHEKTNYIDKVFFENKVKIEHENIYILNDQVNSFEIYDPYGKLSLANQLYEKQIHIQNLYPGIYFLRLTSGKNTNVIRFYKN